MKVLVTGGAGFIGSHVVDAYIREGHEVIVVDNLCSGRMEDVNKKAKLYPMDIRSDEIYKIFDAEKPDVVNHLAAQKSVAKSCMNPMLDEDINIKGFLNVLNNCAKFKIKKVIFISAGGAIYGDAKELPANEACQPDMISPYSISKFTGEKYLQFYGKQYGMKYTILRLANVYGPRQSTDGECGVIPIFLNNLLNRQASSLYTYSDMPKGTTRDYVYVEDVCAANVMALEAGDNCVLNIGTGTETFTEDLYNTMQEITNTYIPIIKELERCGDIRRSVLDSSNAARILGWKPRISIREGIKETYLYSMKSYIKTLD